MKQDSSGLALARGAVKAIALAFGLLGTLLVLMALIGSFAESGWIRFPVALVVAILVPAVLVDRLLPEDDPARARGLPGDVFALVWLGTAVLFAVPLHGLSAKLLAREGDRLTSAGIAPLASVAYLLAGVRAEPAISPAPEPAASGSASALAAGSAPPPPSASAPDSDAGAPALPPKKNKQEGDLAPAELFKKLAPAVVTVSIKGSMGLEGGGTGFLIDDSGTIVTNHHVIASAKELNIRFMNGAVYEEVFLLSEDAGQDLALLQVELKKPKEGESPDDVKPLELGDSEKVVVGERAIAIGNPLGLDHTLTDGLISARRVFQGRHWIQISVPISPGNSGGPLFDMKGKVIGVNTAKVGGGFGGFGENLNLAVPVNVLKGLLKPSYPGRRKFGKGPGSSHW
jgi:serine protease Do